jgi:DNA-binding transcriptional ArsR family regulator
MTYGDALAALGDGTRRAIFERLAERPAAVGELAGDLPVSRPAVSQHLQVDPDGVEALRAYLDQFWNRSLAAFKVAVEQPDEEDS